MEKLDVWLNKGINILNQQDFALLDKQPFIHMPYPLWQLLQGSDLNDTAKAIYTYFYHEANKSRAKQKTLRPVLASRAKLEKIANRKATAVNDALFRLKSAGWITVEQQYSQKTGAQQVCLYWIGIPQDLKAKILAATPRMVKASVGNLPGVTNQTIPDTNMLATISSETSISGIANITEQSTRSVITTDINIENLLASYNENVAVFRQVGTDIAASHRRALNAFDADAKKQLQEYFLNQGNAISLQVTQQVIKAGHAARRAVLGDIVNPSTYQQDLNQNNIVNSPSAVDKSSVVNILGRTQTPHVDFLFNNQQKIHELAKLEIDRLQQAKAIPGNMFFDGKKTQDLIVELAFHAQHYDPAKIQSSLHALRAGVKMIKAGIWNTPLKLRCQRHREAIIREQKTMVAKQEALKSYNRAVYC